MLRLAARGVSLGIPRINTTFYTTAAAISGDVEAALNRGKGTQYKGSFSYKNERVNIVELPDGETNLHIERVTDDVARVFFANKATKKEIPIPASTKAVDISQGTSVPLQPRFNGFWVSWVSNVSVTVGGVEVVRLVNQKQQAVGTNLPIDTL
eukprot:tig00000525_g1960.t1